MSHVAIKMLEKNDTKWRSVLGEMRKTKRYTCFSDDTHTYTAKEPKEAHTTACLL